MLATSPTAMSNVLAPAFYQQAAQFLSAVDDDWARDIGRAWSPYRTIAAWYLWRLPAW
jgi:3-methyladenine DNA glycosylase/8-oxoguanine DNA glycosylase